MADPISLVGLTAGLVSLGLQLSEGLVKYMDALKCREEEITLAKQQVSSLTSLIHTIETAAQQFQSAHPVVSTTVQSSIASCRAELAALEALVLELAGPAQSASGGLRTALKSHGKKLAYVFDRSNLEKLEQKLERTNGQLMLALQTLGIEISGSARGKLLTIESAVTAVDVKVSDESREVKQQIQHTKDSLDSYHGQLSTQITAFDVKITSESQELKQQLQATRGLQIAHHAQLSGQGAVAHRMHLTELDELKTIRAESAARHAEIMSQLELTRQEAQANMTLITSRLMAKPAALKEICDAVQGERAVSLAAHQYSNRLDANQNTSRHSSDHEFQTMLSSLGFVTTCFCRPRKKIEHKLLTHNSQLSLFTESITTEQHSIDCPARRPTGKAQKREYGLVYNGLRRILNVAINISLATNTGAGAWSIAPTFTYYPTVDRCSSPAFQILGLLGDAFQSRWRNHSDFHGLSREWSKLTAVALSKLDSLLRQNKISPRVVDEENQSLAHRAAEVISIIEFRVTKIRSFRGKNSSSIFTPLLQVFKTLVSYDVPVTDYDICGRVPLDHAFPGLDVFTTIFIDLADMIYPAGCDVTPAYRSGTTQYMHTFKEVGPWLRFLNHSSRIAEVYGCGPLSLAVVSNDLEQVKYFLERKPCMLMERNRFGESPLHLACDKPSCLKLILRYAKKELLDDVDNRKYTALQWALIQSGGRCESGLANILCSQCNCAETTAMLLEAGSSLRYYFYERLQSVFNNASYKCKQAFAEHLKKRRDELKALAVNHLSGSEIQGMELQKGSVLDAVVPQVVSLLQRRGVEIPPVLYLPHTGDEDDVVGVYPIYQILDRKSDADIFFGLGFRDMNLSSCYDRWTWGRWPPTYLQWLSQHGADVFFQKLTFSSTGSSLFAAHVTCCELGNWVFNMAYTSNGLVSSGLDDDWVHKVHIAAISAAMADDCRCRCSISGCLPYNFFMAGLDIEFLTCSQLEYRITKLFVNPYLDVFGADLQIAHHYAALRYMTYSALGIPHTCCYSIFGPAFRKSFSEAEINEIQSEHAECLGLLEELLKGFEGQVDAIFSLRTPDQRLPEIIHFWECTWLERMKGVLEQLEGNSLSKEEKAGAERLGVVWNVETPKEDSEPLIGNPYELFSWEYWYYELDKIVV